MQRPERIPVLAVLSLVVATLYLVVGVTPFDLPAGVVPALVLLAMGAAGLSRAWRQLTAPPPSAAQIDPPWLPPVEPPYSPPRF